MSKQPKILVLCTVSTGVDAIAEVHRRGIRLEAIIGLHPDKSDPEVISGYLDIADFAKSLDIPYHYIESYNLKAPNDRTLIEGIDFDLVWVAGWQRLVPGWLISASKMGVLGGHGSPDGISGGRGRSPQNWALLLGCSQFDLALFKITEGVDEGPVIAQRTFYYKENDDIRVSYYRVALAIADMVCEVLTNPEELLYGKIQPSNVFYYPQRKPEDGRVDWSMPVDVIARHCRALTRPYPGIRTLVDQDKIDIIIWECLPFDGVIDGEPGQISQCFFSQEFLVNCLNGRMLVRDWSANRKDWRPKPGMFLQSVPFREQIKTIVHRHETKFPELRVSPRIKRQLL